MRLAPDDLQTLVEAVQMATMSSNAPTKDSGEGESSEKEDF